MTRSAFHQIFDDQKKAAHLTARADLMIAVQELISKSGMNNTQAGKVLGASRSSVSEVMNGKIDRISLDSLTEWLDILSGGKLKVTVVSTAEAKCPTEVVAAIPVEAAS